MTRMRMPRAGWAVAGAALMFGVTGLVTYVSAETPADSPATVFHSISPIRILNTRPGEVNIGTDPEPFGPDETRTLQVAGANGIPADATSVVVNLTVDSTTEWSFLTLWPSGEERPDVSNINWTGAKQTIANLATVQLGEDGALQIYNAFGSTDVLIDISGYYSEGNFVTLPPESSTSTTTPESSTSVPETSTTVETSSTSSTSSTAP